MTPPTTSPLDLEAIERRVAEQGLRGKDDIPLLNDLAVLIAEVKALRSELLEMKKDMLQTLEREPYLDW